jgi:hypothetical protein
VIERSGDEFELICDHCNDTEDGFKTFDDAKDYKVENWKSVKTRTQGWVELCPDCSTYEIIREYREK